MKRLLAARAWMKGALREALVCYQYGALRLQWLFWG